MPRPPRLGPDAGLLAGDIVDLIPTSAVVVVTMRRSAGHGSTSTSTRSATTSTCCARPSPRATCGRSSRPNGYGHGAIEVARAALDAGAGGLCVALVRRRRRAAPWPASTRRSWCCQRAAARRGERHRGQRPDADRVHPTASSTRSPLRRAAGRTDRTVHVKVDTGMQRVGARPAGGGGARRAIGEHSPTLRLGGVFTHLAVADEPGDEFTATQLGRFDEVLSTLGVPDEMCSPRREFGGSARLIRRRVVRSCGRGSRCTGSRRVRVSTSCATTCGRRSRCGPACRSSRPFVRVSGSPTDSGTRSTATRQWRPCPIGYADGVPRRLSSTRRRTVLIARSPLPDRRRGDDGSADGRLRIGRRCRRRPGRRR